MLGSGSSAGDRSWGRPGSSYRIHAATETKIIVARALSIPVVPVGVRLARRDSVDTVETAFDWLAVDYPFETAEMVT